MTIRAEFADVLVPCVEHPVSRTRKKRYSDLGLGSELGVVPCPAPRVDPGDR